jgi:NTE family protein
MPAKRAVVYTIILVSSCLTIRAFIPAPAYPVHRGPDFNYWINKGGNWRHVQQDADAPPKYGTALCLSGGGYRATLFDLGVIWRLNELGTLRRVRLVSAVSGGAITGAFLVVTWPKFQFTSRDVAWNFRSQFAEPILAATQKSIAAQAVIKSIFSLHSAAEGVAGQYDDLLFHGARLRDLPSTHIAPELWLNSTRLEDGSSWTFGQYGIAAYEWPLARGDARGDDRELPVAIAVAASSAFPPILGPVRLDMSELFPSEYLIVKPETSGVFGEDADGVQFSKAYAHRRHLMASHVSLVDGGVRNNLGREACTKNNNRTYTTVMTDAATPVYEEDVGPSWPQILYRVLNLMYLVKEETARPPEPPYGDVSHAEEESTQNEVSLSRAENLLMFTPSNVRELSGMASTEQFSPQDRNLIMNRWASSAEDIEVLRTHATKAVMLASIPTDLGAVSPEDQHHLVNMGYVLTDAELLSSFLLYNAAVGLRSGNQLPDFVPNLLSAPVKLPYPLHHCLTDKTAKCNHSTVPK